MALLWITMVTAFPAVVMGFEWYKRGFTLTQVIACTVMASAFLLLYAIPSCYIGAVTGLNYSTLSRIVFGRAGVKFVAANLIWIFVAWYGLAALLLAEAIQDHFHLPIALPVLSGILGALMAVNNIFGFKGVAAFARYIAGPILIAFICVTFGKSTVTCTSSVLTAVPAHSWWTAAVSISAFVIGFASWGNEADYWRYSKPSVKACAIPLVISLLLGQVIFPVTGWMGGQITGVTDSAAFTSAFDQFALGKAMVFALLVLAVSYFAANDSNLFGSVQAWQNLTGWKHRHSVLILTVLGVAMAVWLSHSGAAKALEQIAALNCIILPPATMVIMLEVFIFGRKSWTKEGKFLRAPRGEMIGSVQWPALITLTCTYIIGIATSGVIPGTAGIKTDLAWFLSWTTCFVLYMVLRSVTEVVASRRYQFVHPEPVLQEQELVEIS